MQNVAQTMKPGALLFVRDYAVGDLAECKLGQQAAHRRIGSHFYARGDGTRAFYFSEVTPFPALELSWLGLRPWKIYDFAAQSLLTVSRCKKHTAHRL